MAATTLQINKLYQVATFHEELKSNANPFLPTSTWLVT